MRVPKQVKQVVAVPPVYRPQRGVLPVQAKMAVALPPAVPQAPLRWPRTGLIQRAAMSKEAGLSERNILQPVSEASDSHWLENLNNNFKSIASHANFSLAPKAMMSADMEIINQFVAAYKGKADWTAAAEEVSYEICSGGRIEYTVNGRVYSTHGATHQIYPLNGVDVINGTGAIAIGKILKDRHILSDERKITLELILNPVKDRWGNVAKEAQMGKKEKQKLIDQFMSRL